MSIIIAISLFLISKKEIFDILKQSPAKNKICILECCRSETLFVGPSQHSQLEKYSKKLADNTDDIIVITSTETGSNSIEYPEKGGIFSHYFLFPFNFFLKFFLKKLFKKLNIIFLESKI